MKLNHALHMAAVTQIRNRGTAGRAYYDRKRAEGMTGKCALRALKRKISDAIYHRLVRDTRQQMRSKTKDPEGNRERLCIQRGRLTPRTTSPSEKPLPGRRQPYDPPASTTASQARSTNQDRSTRLLTQRGLDMAGNRSRWRESSRADAEICRRRVGAIFRICLMSGARFSVMVMLLAGPRSTTLAWLRAVRVIPCGARSRQTGRSCPPRSFVVLRRDVPGPAVEA